MKLLLMTVITAPLFAQQAAPTPPAAPAAAAAPAPSPISTTENWLTGYIELGYQGRTGVAGSLSTYRSIVDLGSGPKLLGAEFTVTDPKKRFFDHIDVRAFDWGGDPYSTLHVDAVKQGSYRFDADYRSMAYYNNLPSFADPSLAVRGIALDEQSFDTRRHLGSYNLELFPSKQFTPYFSFERDSSSGRGVSSFSDSFANEYAVPDTTSDRTSLYRGGLRMAFGGIHATVEEGGTKYREDQNVFVPAGSSNPGDVTTPYLGTPLVLTRLAQAYGVRGSGTYTKGLFTASPYKWIDLNGQFLFSQASNTVNYTQYDTGNFAELSSVLFLTSEQYLIASSAKLPHTSAGFGADVRPFKRFRVLESWMTDRLHNAGNSNVAPLVSALNTTLASNYSQQETMAFFDVNKKFMLRGGYRRVWGDGNNLVLPAAGLLTTQRATLSRNVAIAGLAYRPSQKLSIHGDTEWANSGGEYFRSSLYNYQKIRAQGRYQLFTTLNLSADASYLNNHNPNAGQFFNYHVMQEAVSLQWAPARIKRITLQGSYRRSGLYSNISYLIPQTLASASSLYRENDHSVTSLIVASLPFGVKITAGGSASLAAGTRPTNYYQPVAKFSAPFGRGVSCFAEWRYYGFGETYYLYESFRTHIFTAGLRFSR
jgi:hypothetical protein